VIAPNLIDSTFMPRVTVGLKVWTEQIGVSGLPGLQRHRAMPMPFDCTGSERFTIPAGHGDPAPAEWRRWICGWLCEMLQWTTPRACGFDRNSPHGQGPPAWSGQCRPEPVAPGHQTPGRPQGSGDGWQILAIKTQGRFRCDHKNGGPQQSKGTGGGHGPCRGLA